MQKFWYQTAQLIVLINIIISPTSASTITAESCAVLTDAHNHVEKRAFIDWSRHVWGEPSKAITGDLLPEGTQLGTGDKSWAQISWPKVTTRIWEDSVVAIAPNKRIVYLLDGEMLFNLDKNHKVSENCEIWTKLLQAKVHGTTFIAQSTADFCRISVLEGSLDITNRTDNSVVRIGPGVVYEVRSGAPPPATWIKQDNSFFDSMKKSNTSPFQMQSGNNESRQPPWPSFRMDEQGQSRFKPFSPPNPNIDPKYQNMTEAEMDRKASEMAGGDMEKKRYFLEKMRKHFAEMREPYGYQPYRQSTEPHKHSELEIENKAQELSQGDPQKKQFFLKKLHELNGDRPVAAAPSAASTVSQMTPLAPFVDTSEFGPIKAAKSMPRSHNHKAAFVDDISSHAVPPVSLFRTTKSATNLYLVDVKELWVNHLVQGFSEKLPSLPIVETELRKLPSICRVDTKYDNNPDLLAQRNSVLASQAKIIHGPNDKVYEVGKEMVDKLTLPGQVKSEEKKNN
jgi:hypothetical protein